MAIPLSPLPFAADALAPHISAATLQVHHGAHHKGYVDKVNAAIMGTELDDSDLETIVGAASDRGDSALFNNAAQAWNHGFYWHSLSAERTRPQGDLAVAIDRAFGSLSGLQEALTAQATDHFASGWAWLVATDSGLSVISTHDAGTALTKDVIPLLTLDVWEHAYYLDVQNERRAYADAVVENCLNWDFASENFRRAAVWQYPRQALVA